MERLGINLQTWQGPGTVDSVRETHLSSYIYKPDKHRLGVKANRKDRAPDRWRTWSIVKVAELIERRLPEIRKALKFVEEPDFLLTQPERIAALEAHNAQLEVKLAAAAKEATLARNAHRMAAGRAAEQVTENCKVRDAKADALMQRRVAAGISDPWEAMQGLHAPEFNQELVGKRIEVCWKYFDKDTDKPVLIWTPGRVVRVADGLTDKRSKRARNVLPGGALLWAWDADEAFGETAGGQWLILLPQKWNPKTACVYGWRFDSCDCASAASPVPANKRQNVRRGSVEDMDTDDER